MNEFELYMKIGRDHIMDINGYDHILFLVALCAIYSLTQWRTLLILVTAFTIGHSITLALSVMGWTPFSSSFIEFLIPITILLTAVYNIRAAQRDEGEEKLLVNYGLALVFGFIHGMGFSNYLRALLGEEESILLPLLAFNVGLEIGQLIIVAIIMGISYLAMNAASVRQQVWQLAVSAAAGVMALYLVFQNITG